MATADHVQDSLYEAFTGVAAISSIVGTRITPNRLPQDQPLPAIWYSRVSKPIGYTQSERSTFVRDRFEISCVAATYGEAHDLKREIVNRFAGFQGKLGSTNETDVDGILIEAERDDYDDPHGDGRHRVVLDVVIMYRESTG